MAHDTLDIEILDGGAVRVTTGAISATNHGSAARFVHEIARRLVGACEHRAQHGRVRAGGECLREVAR